MNKVQLVGRLTKDIELRSSKDGKSYAYFTLAIKGFGKDRTEFIPCVAWNKVIEYLHQYAGKGDWIGVDGKMNAWTTSSQDQKQNHLVINATQCEIYFSKKTNDELIDNQPIVENPFEKITSNNTNNDEDIDMNNIQF